MVRDDCSVLVKSPISCPYKRKANFLAMGVAALVVSSLLMPFPFD